jgi:NAD(P)-dependent dehydrogenase (short-subunit alcohol dehydrogenase family)
VPPGVLDGRRGDHGDGAVRVAPTGVFYLFAACRSYVSLRVWGSRGRRVAGVVSGRVSTARELTPLLAAAYGWVMGEQSDGQVALVSGASRGIGLGIAQALTRAGHRVALVARPSEALERATIELGEHAVAVSGDVTEPAEVTRAVAQVEEALGPVDLLVHNAGSADVVGPLWEAEPDAWWDEVAVHLRGAMLLAHACLPSMLARRNGRVVLLYGNLGDRDQPWCTAYAAGKAGLLRLAGQLHAELDGTGVRVFGLHPGLVWTPMTAALARDPEKRRWLPNFARRPREDYGTTEPAEEMIVRIAAGEADPLAGLLLGAGDDLDELREQADQLRAEQRRTLRVM